MSRPYFQLGIEEITKIVEENSDSLEILNEIRHELTFRTRPKARLLLAKLTSRLTVLTGIAPDSVAHEVTETDAQTTDSSLEPEEEESISRVFPEIPPLPDIASLVETGTPSAAFRDKAAILNYWRAIELFLPQPLPQVDPRGKEPVYSIDETSPLPWEETHLHCTKRAPQNCQWRYCVYAGSFPQEVISTETQRVFGSDPEAVDGRLDGEVALFSLILTHKARPLLDTFVLSSGAWALGRLSNPGPTQPEWLQGFELTQAHLRLYLEEVFALEASDEEGKDLVDDGIRIGCPASGPHFFEALQRIISFLNLGSIPVEVALRIKCVPMHYKKIYSTDDQDALNSFFVKDLAKVGAAVSTGEISPPLAAYMASDAEAAGLQRQDVDQDDPMVFCWNKLQPTLFPSSKWPAPGHHPLVYSQQIAVNELSRTLAQQGLFAVNGPPGTGKTTLLRDIISAIVTARAEALANLPSPKAGFDGHCNWKSDKFTKQANLLVPSLLGFDMVVASSNNGAVENITLELPGLHTVDPSWLEGFDYFSDFATQLIQKEAWGLTAARLGNKQNRRDFLNRFWFGNDFENGEVRPGFRDYLKQAETRVIDWQAAVDQFKETVQAENIIRQARDAGWNAVLEFQRLSEKKNQLQEALAVLEKKRDELKTQAEAKKAEVDRCLEESKAAKERRTEHHVFKPSLWETIITLGRVYQEWREKDRGHLTVIEKLERCLKKLQTEQQELQFHLDETETYLRQQESELAQATAALFRCETNIARIREELGPHFVWTEEWHQNKDIREQSAPWSDETWNLARARVFISALKLHKAFIEANAKAVRQNLDVLVDILSGGLASHAPLEGVMAAWQTLFLITPVISTTFASFDRLLPFHGVASIGWLFIDEAGQAAPQAAAGALWRSRRAVIVGDPLQLEPIVPVPFKTQDGLRRYFKVGVGWRPSETSCQSLADRASRFGAYLKTENENLWVGSPLRVHRRCDNPMFTISNQVAYNGTMVFGTGVRPALPYEESAWFDVQSEEADHHWIPAEGDVVVPLIQRLIQAGIDPKQIFLITPFRSVVSELWNIARNYKGIRAGTIHTVQGKEADVVIFVLGGNPKRPGAKDWASEKPNLINVAVSRAKRRIYVVGNRTEWSKCNYFKILAHHLSENNSL